MIKILFISFFLLTTIVNAQERSMFGAGDLNSPTPYGLTETEKVIVKNKKALSKNEKRIKKVDSALNDLFERIDGLESIYEGDSTKLNKIYKQFNFHIDSYKQFLKDSAIKDQQSIQVLNKIQEDFKLQLDEMNLKIVQNTENIRVLKKSFDKIVVLVNDINNQYVTKKEFEQLLKLLDKKEKKKSSNSVKGKSNKKILEEVRSNMKNYYYTKSIPLLKHLIASKYRPAECNYYMGEIMFHKKKYKDALGYYKTSMMLYDKAKYLPRLLLNSAISFEKIGDLDNALNFYNTLIEVYPNTKEAKEASKKLN